MRHGEVEARAGELREVLDVGIAPDENAARDIAPQHLGNGVLDPQLLFGQPFEALGGNGSV